MHTFLQINALILLSAKKYNTNEDKVIPRCVDCMYCGMPKGISWAEMASETNQACSPSHY